MLSPRELPADLQRRIRAEAVEGGLSARVLYGRYDLGSLGIKYDSFRKYVAAIGRKAPLVMIPPGSSARIEAVARSLVTWLDIAFTAKASEGIVAELCRDRLGKALIEAGGRKIPARSAALARRLDAFLSLAFDRSEVDRLTRALGRWRLGEWHYDGGSLTVPRRNPCGWAEADAVPTGYIGIPEACRRARRCKGYKGSKTDCALRGWAMRLAKRLRARPNPPVLVKGRGYIDPALDSVLSGRARSRGPARGAKGGHR